MKYLGETQFDHGETPGLGVLLLNLGTPDAPDTASVRRYLAEFLWDPRVIELPRPLWWLVLHGVVLRWRPRRSARAYRRIWQPEGSPLLIHTEALAKRLRRELARALPGPVAVAVGMTYGNPAIGDALAELHDARARRLLVLPLYPQYSATSTGAALDRVMHELGCWRWLPELRTIGAYHDEPLYIRALAASIEAHWAGHGRGERLLFSFHGIPKRYFKAGDPYFCHCQKTARLVAEELALRPGSWTVSFQSRVGREPWLEPYTDVTLQNWGEGGVGDVDVICPGFAADCLETLEEIAIENREALRDAGGGELRYVPALNASDAHVALLVDLVRRHCCGWPEAEEGYDRQAQAAFAEQTMARARALGAA